MRVYCGLAGAALGLVGGVSPRGRRRLHRDGGDPGDRRDELPVHRHRRRLALCLDDAGPRRARASARRSRSRSGTATSSTSFRPSPSFSWASRSCSARFPSLIKATLDVDEIGRWGAALSAVALGDDALHDPGDVAPLATDVEALPRIARRWRGRSSLFPLLAFAGFLPAYPSGGSARPRHGGGRAPESRGTTSSPPR